MKKILMLIPFFAGNTYGSSVTLAMLKQLVSPAVGSKLLMKAGMQPYSTKTVNPLIEFDRDEMSRTDHEEPARVEGYWASPGSQFDISKDRYQGRYPFPKANAEPWPTQKVFLQRLARIERKVSQIANRGCSPSRFEDGFLGNIEYQDTSRDPRVCWTEDFGPYYVKGFNVKPSREFYEYVMSHEFGKKK